MWKKYFKNLFSKNRNPDVLDSQEFYELMQTYRMSSLYNQETVIKNFEYIKDFIRKNFKVIHR